MAHCPQLENAGSAGTDSCQLTKVDLQWEIGCINIEQGLLSGDPASLLLGAKLLEEKNLKLAKIARSGTANHGARKAVAQIYEQQQQAWNLLR